jgi:hypothetical protein
MITLFVNTVSGWRGTVQEEPKGKFKAKERGADVEMPS